MQQVFTTSFAAHLLFGPFLSYCFPILVFLCCPKLSILLLSCFFVPALLSSSISALLSYFFVPILLSLPILALLSRFSIPTLLSYFPMPTLSSLPIPAFLSFLMPALLSLLEPTLLSRFIFNLALTCLIFSTLRTFKLALSNKFLARQLTSPTSLKLLYLFLIHGSFPKNSNHNLFFDTIFLNS